MAGERVAGDRARGQRHRRRGRGDRGRRPDGREVRRVPGRGGRRRRDPAHRGEGWAGRGSRCAGGGGGEHGEEDEEENGRTGGGALVDEGREQGAVVELAAVEGQRVAHRSLVHRRRRAGAVLEPDGGLPLEADLAGEAEERRGGVEEAARRGRREGAEIL